MPRGQQRYLEYSLLNEAAQKLQMFTEYFYFKMYKM